MMDERDEERIHKVMKDMLHDPVVLKELEKMRDRGMDEAHVQNWLRQMAMLQGK